MSVGSIYTLPPVYQLPQQTQSVQKATAQATPVASGDSDGDSDGSGGASAPLASSGVGSKVNILA